MSFLFTISIPLIGKLYVDLDSTDAIRGRILQCTRYRSETFVRVAFIHAVWTPRSWKRDDHAQQDGPSA